MRFFAERTDSLALPALSGLLLFLSIGLFAGPMPALPLAFVALVPLLRFLDAAPTLRRAALGGVVFGAACFFPACSFLIALQAYSGLWILVYLYCVLNSMVGPAILGCLAFVVRRRSGLPFTVFFPALYVLLEQLRIRGEVFFPVDHLANTLTAFPAWIQFAEWTGASGVTFWIVAVGSLAYDAGHALVSGRRLAGRATLAGALLLFLAGPVSGWVVLHRWEGGRRELRVALMQPDVEIERKRRWIDPGDPAGSAEARADDLAELVRNGRQAAASGAQLVVLPESARPGGIVFGPDLLPDAAEQLADLRSRERRRVNERLQRDGGEPLEPSAAARDGRAQADPLFQDLADETGVPFLYGADLSVSYDPDFRSLDDYELYNGVVLARPGSATVDWTAKFRLVPFAEGIPMAGWLGLDPREGRRQRHRALSLLGGFTPGRPRVLESEAGRFGALICYEGLFPYLSRRFRNQGAEFLVAATNDRWFGYSSFAAWHARALALRAIENRVPIVRSSNSGPSCIVDARGILQDATPAMSRAAGGVGSVALGRPPTFYDRVGDWPVWLSASLLFFSGAWGVARRAFAALRAPAATIARRQPAGRVPALPSSSFLSER